MKKIASLFSCFIWMMWIPASALAWGQATHAYFAKALVNGDVNLLEIYGAMAPDLFNLMTDSPDYDYLVKETHRRYEKVVRESLETELRPFAFGFACHNDRRGADRTAHRHGRTTKEGYVITKSSGLALNIRPEVQVILEDAGVPFALLVAGPLALELAHPLVETAIDLLVKRNEDPSIGLQMLQAAQDRPSSIPDLLVEAYGKGFARHMHISYEETDQLIRTAEVEFQQLMILYGEILNREEPEAIRALADQGGVLLEEYISSATGKEVDVPVEVLEQFLLLAIQQVEGDYSEEISATLTYLKKILAHLNHLLMEN